MTLLIDHHENRNHPDLTVLLAQSVDIHVGDYNQSSGDGLIYPDFHCAGGEKLLGINRKSVHEFLSSPERVVEQIQRELAGPCEWLVLLIEGIMAPDSGSGAWGYSMDWATLRTYPNTDQRGTVGFKRQHYNTNWEHIQNQQTRLEWLGIQVVHSYSVVDTASKLVALHKMAMDNRPNRVLDQLIKTDIAVLALDPVEKAMAHTLMGISGGGCGEQVALTIAQSFSTIVELIEYWSSGGTISDQMLRSGTRRVGVAAEKKLQKALGWVCAS